MRTNYVLIDFESVQPNSFKLLQHDHFKVLVFVGSLQTKVSIEIAATIQPLGDKAEYIKITGNGRNALDFHIAYYIGQLAAKDPLAHFCIISKDTGFDPLISHLKSKGIRAARAQSVDEVPAVKDGCAKSAEEHAKLFIAKLSRTRVARPRTVVTLTRALAAFVQHQLSDTQMAAVVDEMAKQGFISLADGKVTYEAAG